MIVYGFRQIGCELYYKDVNNNWIKFADINQCQDNETIPGKNGKQKRCNIASFLAEVVLPDAVAQTINAKQETINNINFFSAFTAMVAALTAPITGGTTLLFVMAGASYISGMASGVSGIVSVLSERDVNQIESEIDNAYWLEIRQRLYCAIPPSGVLSQRTLYLLSREIETIPGKPNANDLVSTLLRSLSPETALKAAQIGAQINSEISACEIAGCDTCEFSAGTYGHAEFSNNKWILSGTQINNSRYIGSFYQPYASNPCRIKSIQMLSGSLDTISYRGEGKVVSDYPASVTMAQSLNELVNKCLGTLSFSSREPFSIEVELTDCAEYIEEDTGFLLYDKHYSISDEKRVPLQTGILDYGEGGNIFNLSSLETLPDENGWYHYYLKTVEDCATIQFAPLTLPGETPITYGLQPPEIKIVDCDGIWQDYQSPDYYDAQNSAPKMPTLNEEGICFRSFAFKAPYHMRVRISPCDNIPEQVVIIPNQNRLAEYGTDCLIEYLSSSRWRVTGYIHPTDNTQKTLSIQDQYLRCWKMQNISWVSASSLHWNHRWMCNNTYYGGFDVPGNSVSLTEIRFFSTNPAIPFVVEFDAVLDE